LIVVSILSGDVKPLLSVVIEKLSKCLVLTRTLLGNQL